MTYSRILFTRVTGVASGAGTAYPSGASKFTPVLSLVGSSLSDS